MTVTKIHHTKQPTRPHFIKEWAEKRSLKQVDIATELGADKGLVSRWFKGTTPSPEYQERLAALFHCEPESLFRNPDEDWFVKFFADRQKDEVEKMRQMLELAFPRKVG